MLANLFSRAPAYPRCTPHALHHGVQSPTLGPSCPGSHLLSRSLLKMCLLEPSVGANVCALSSDGHQGPLPLSLTSCLSEQRACASPVSSPCCPRCQPNPLRTHCQAAPMPSQRPPFGFYPRCRVSIHPHSIRSYYSHASVPAAPQFGGAGSCPSILAPAPILPCAILRRPPCLCHKERGTRTAAQAWGRWGTLSN